MSIWRLVCCALSIDVVLFPESSYWIFIIFNPIAKILILRDSVVWYVQSRLSKTADLLDLPLHLLHKRKGISSKSAVLDKRLCTYHVAESRRINIFAIGFKIMKIQNLLSGNNTTAMFCAQHTRCEIDIGIFFHKKYLFYNELPRAADLQGNVKENQAKSDFFKIFRKLSEKSEKSWKIKWKIRIFQKVQNIVHYFF